MLLTALPLSATSLKELWTSAPDSLFPYLSKAKRVELVELWDVKTKGHTDAESNVKIEVQNNLDGTVVLDTLTSDFMQVRLNKLTEVQMKLMVEEGDTLICFVKTLSMPESDSEVTYYNQDWQMKRRVNLKWRNYLSKPDTMDNETFKQLSQSIRLAFVKASIHPDDEQMEVSVELPLQPKDKKDELEAILQRNVKIVLSDVK